MADAVSIVFNKRQLDEVQRVLRAIPRGWQTAASRAINKTATTLKSKIVKKIHEYMPIKQKDIRQQVKLKKATRGFLEAVIRIMGGRTPLIKFGARETAKGVTYKLQGKKHRLAHAFIKTMPSGHTGVFERTGLTRLPVKERFGPSVLTAYLKHDMKIRVSAADLLQKNLDMQIRLLLERGK